MIKNTFLGIGPMSKEIINSLDYFSKKKNSKIMLICSRNQIESKRLGSGYVNKFSTKTFSEFIKSKKNSKLIMCRDHSGPYKKDGKKENIYKEVENTKISLLDDIINDFQILHIDTSECGKAKYEIAKELIIFCNNNAKKYKKKVFFEFGCEDHGVLTSLKKFKQDINFLKNFSNRQYIVCQTGSLVKSVFQVGQFDVDTVKAMSKIANVNGILLKEHNCDYLNNDEIILRKKNGINAINIAPEFGVLQTRMTYYLSKQLGLDKDIIRFKKLVLKKKKWNKWLYNNENNLIKFFSSGHYHFNENIYKQLIFKINKKINFQKKLDEQVFNKLNKFI